MEHKTFEDILLNDLIHSIPRNKPNLFHPHPRRHSNRNSALNLLNPTDKKSEMLEQLIKKASSKDKKTYEKVVKLMSGNIRLLKPDFYKKRYETKSVQKFVEHDMGLNKRKRVNTESSVNKEYKQVRDALDKNHRQKMETLRMLDQEEKERRREKLYSQINTQVQLNLSSKLDLKEMFKVSNQKKKNRALFLLHNKGAFQKDIDDDLEAPLEEAIKNNLSRVASPELADLANRFKTKDNNLIRKKDIIKRKKIIESEFQRREDKIFEETVKKLRADERTEKIIKETNQESDYLFKILQSYSNNLKESVQKTLSNIYVNHHVNLGSKIPSLGRVKSIQDRRREKVLQDAKETNDKLDEYKKEQKIKMRKKIFVNGILMNKKRRNRGKSNKSNKKVGNVSRPSIFQKSDNLKAQNNSRNKTTVRKRSIIKSGRSKGALRPNQYKFTKMKPKLLTKSISSRKDLLLTNPGQKSDFRMTNGTYGRNAFTRKDSKSRMYSTMDSEAFKFTKNRKNFQKSLNKFGFSREKIREFGSSTRTAPRTLTEKLSNRNNLQKEIHNFCHYEKNEREEKLNNLIHLIQLHEQETIIKDKEFLKKFSEKFRTRTEEKDRLRRVLSIEEIFAKYFTKPEEEEIMYLANKLYQMSRLEKKRKILRMSVESSTFSDGYLALSTGYSDTIKINYLSNGSQINGGRQSRKASLLKNGQSDERDKNLALEEGKKNKIEEMSVVDYILKEY